jgi:hypothetical protein
MTGAVDRPSGKRTGSSEAWSEEARSRRLEASDVVPECDAGLAGRESTRWPSITSLECSEEGMASLARLRILTRWASLLRGWVICREIGIYTGKMTRISA